MFSQREGVYAAVTAYLSEKGRPFDQGMKVELDDSDKATIVEMIAASIESGAVRFGAADKYDTPEKLRDGYCKSLLSNWLRRDERLNGGKPYEPENPGSRFGYQDSIIKNLRALLKTTTDELQADAIEEAITKRQDELRTEKLKAKVKIDINHIPAEFRHLVK